jgi:hypothetical protein
MDLGVVGGACFRFGLKENREQEVENRIEEC